MTKRLLYCGLVAGPVFVLAFLLEGATKGNGYEVLRHPVSSLALGEHGWTQTMNFLVCGTLTVAFALGLWRSRRVARAGAVLVGIWGLGLIGAGVFTTDPFSGYPLGTPATPDYTTSGALHDGISIVGFLALGLAQLVLARGQGRAWAVYSVVSAVAYLVAFFLASAGFSQEGGLVEVAGLLQRLTVVIGWGWLAALAWRLR